MEIINISQNDDLQTMARKCDKNFKQLGWSLNQSAKKQARIERGEIETIIDEIVSSLVNQVIPNVVSAEVARQDIPTIVATAVTSKINEMDIPSMIEDEVTNRLTPPVGTYVISDTDPSLSYEDTAWQSDTITTGSSVIIKIWKRIS